MPRPIRGKDEFFPRLEALRGLAALMVVAFHAWQSPWHDPSGATRSFVHSTAKNLYGGWTTELLTILGNGIAAVNLFFVISGFVLLQSLARGPDSNWTNAARFVVARVFRVYPAVFVTIGTFAVIFYAAGASICDPPSYEPIRLLRNALLVDTEIDGVMWTLKVEMIAIPLFILGGFLFRNFGSLVLAALLAVLLVLPASSTWTHLVDTPFGLALLPFFGVGMLVFGAGRKPWSWLPSHLAAALVVAALVALLSAQRMAQGGAPPHHVEMVCDAVIVGLLAFGSLGPVGKLFDHPLMRFYGRISYSFYLLNPLTLFAFWHMPDTLGWVMQLPVPGILIALALFVISVAVTTPIAWLMYQYVERPGIALGRRLLAGQFTEWRPWRGAEPDLSKPASMTDGSASKWRASPVGLRKPA